MYQVRDGKRVVPTCPECGCRLKYNESVDSWSHIFGTGYDDSRGHKCGHLGVFWVRKDNLYIGVHTSSNSLLKDIAPILIT